MIFITTPYAYGADTPPPPELLEFLGSFGDEEDQWQDPFELPETPTKTGNEGKRHRKPSSAEDNIYDETH